MEKLFRVDSVENLLTKQEKLVWKVDPLLKGKDVLERTTEVTVDGDYLITPI